MDFKDFQYILAIGKYGNITKAAEALDQLQCFFLLVIPKPRWILLRHTVRRVICRIMHRSI